MWRPTHRPATSTLPATLALALILATTLDARAAAVQSYSDTINGAITGPSNAPISFIPQSSQGTFTTPGSIDLGEFVTNPLPTSATLTYNNTPFWINLNVSAISSSGIPIYYGFNSNSDAYQYQIAGVLNGTIGGDGSSNMMATITGITGTGFGLATTPPFSVADLQVNVPQGIAAPNGNDSGITALTAHVAVAGTPLPNPSPAPEPSTIAVFGLALAGWAWHRRSKSRPRGDRSIV